MPSRIKRLLEHKEHIRKRMWKTALKDAQKGEEIAYAILRVAIITWVGIKENRLINRAAALSFSSLIGLIPMTAIMIAVSGFALEKTDPDLVINNIYKGIRYIAPQLGKLETLSEESPAEGEEGRAQLKVYLEEFVEASQSGAVGIGGMIALILIVIQLFSSIEGALNDIWGVKRGRSWVMKVGMYWTVITLGTVVAGTGLALLAAQALKWSDMAATLPPVLGLEFLIKTATQIGSFFMLGTVLATFYRFIPNTLVTWKASFIGAFFTLACISLYNWLAFPLFSNRVDLEKSLYGSLAIIPVLMLGMYVFWFVTLLGGRVTYAVQNAHFKTDNVAWNPLSFASKESISLLLFSRICRQFRNCQPALSGRELAELSRLPVQFVNASLNRLCEQNLVSSIPPEEGEPYQNYRYQPAMPLDRIDLKTFKALFENHGDSPDEELFDDYDPIVQRYHASLEQARQAAFEGLSMETMIQLTEGPDPAHSETREDQASQAEGPSAEESPTQEDAIR